MDIKMIGTDPGHGNQFTIPAGYVFAGVVCGGRIIATASTGAASVTVQAFGYSGYDCTLPSGATYLGFDPQTGVVYASVAG